MTTPPSVPTTARVVVERPVEAEVPGCTSTRRACFGRRPWWAIEITSGLPDHMLGVTQTRRLSNVRRAAVYRQADKVEAAARTEAAQPRSRAAAGLLDARLTIREAGILLGISHQRIKQLADRAASTTR